MSNTPRTDEEVAIAKKFPMTSHGLWVSTEFARQLERELVEAMPPPAVRAALLVLLNHVEPGWDNCRTVVQMWLAKLGAAC